MNNAFTSIPIWGYSVWNFCNENGTAKAFLWNKAQIWDVVSKVRLKRSRAYIYRGSSSSRGKRLHKPAAKSTLRIADEKPGLGAERGTWRLKPARGFRTPPVHTGPKPAIRTFSCLFQQFSIYIDILKPQLIQWAGAGKAFVRKRNSDKNIFLFFTLKKNPLFRFFVFCVQWIFCKINHSLKSFSSSVLTFDQSFFCFLY